MSQLQSRVPGQIVLETLLIQAAKSRVQLSLWLRFHRSTRDAFIFGTFRLDPTYRQTTDQEKHSLSRNVEHKARKNFLSPVSFTSVLFCSVTIVDNLEFVTLTLDSVRAVQQTAITAVLAIFFAIVSLLRFEGTLTCFFISSFWFSFLKVPPLRYCAHRHNATRKKG